jgi:hypothetical protein
MRRHDSQTASIIMGTYCVCLTSFGYPDCVAGSLASTAHPAESLDFTEVRERFRSDRAGGNYGCGCSPAVRSETSLLDGGIWSERGCALAA